MKILFIGGTGNISTACARLTIELGHELTLLNRGRSHTAAPLGAHLLLADIEDLKQVETVLRDSAWDVVVDWIVNLPRQAERDIGLFQGRTAQYFFISSASAYQKPPNHYLITENTPRENPFWQYARDKIACEQRLRQAFEQERFPVTIVRPSHTYGESWIPCAVGGHDYTVVQRMKAGKKVLVHGDGQSLWVMTHNADFARGLLGLFGNQTAIGEAFHITADEVLTWDRIYQIIAEAAGCDPDLIHIPSDFIARFDERARGSLLGDKAYSVVFDNSKIKKFVPGFEAKINFAEGMRRSMAWFEAAAERRKVNRKADELMDRILAAYQG